MCSQSDGLESLGLADIRVLVRLMSLAAGRRAHTCVDKQSSVKEMETDRSNPSYLNFLTTAIGSVVSHSPTAYRQLVEICTRVRLSCIAISLLVKMHYVTVLFKLSQLTGTTVFACRT